MNHEFERRWKIGAAAARSVRRGDEEVQAPPGFAERVLAARDRPSSPAPSLAMLWQTLSLRTLGVLAALLVLLALLAAWADPSPPALSSPIAESVGEQLPWFE